MFYGEGKKKRFKRVGQWDQNGINGQGTKEAKPAGNCCNAIAAPCEGKVVAVSDTMSAKWGKAHLLLVHRTFDSAILTPFL